MTGDVPLPDVIALWDGRILKIHSLARCVGDRCCIHHPSEHPLADAPLSWCRDRRIMERLCVHGVYHPDPDDVAVRLSVRVALHLCDGCCGQPFGVPPDDL